MDDMDEQMRTTTRRPSACGSRAAGFRCELPLHHDGVHRRDLGVDVFIWDDEGNSRWFRGDPRPSASAEASAC